MKRNNKICSHPVWKKYMLELEELEKSRIFCKHGIEHLLDVARIAYIKNLENSYNIEKELIYAAALLHDLGRSLQYTQGIPHEKAVIPLAKEILEDCKFAPEEQEEILAAIACHRAKENQENRGLSELLYWADKQSRMCGFCKASAVCNWSEEKKNHLLFL